MPPQLEPDQFDDYDKFDNLLKCLSAFQGYIKSYSYFVFDPGGYLLDSVHSGAI